MIAASIGERIKPPGFTPYFQAQPISPLCTSEGVCTPLVQVLRMTKVLQIEDVTIGSTSPLPHVVLLLAIKKERG